MQFHERGLENHRVAHVHQAAHGGRVVPYVHIEGIHGDGLFPLGRGQQVRGLRAHHAEQIAAFRLHDHFVRGQHARVYAAVAPQAQTAVVLDFGHAHADLVHVRAQHNHGAALPLARHDAAQRVDFHAVAQGTHRVCNIVRDRALLPGHTGKRGGFPEKLDGIHAMITLTFSPIIPAFSPERNACTQNEQAI